MFYRKQILAARAILEINRLELSAMSGVAAVTIGRIELSEKAFNKASSITIRKIREALMDKGIKFLPPTDERGGVDGIGVRYFPSESKKPEKD